ncbi:hypothetical protein [Acinetobacter sp. CFCC 10889]|uniref:hypothetical protein n=1 Tax=Acinetobacter sp. CFCC 10889 TaxID=1775557 RepID=UPI0013A6BD48|nr:hypothetical protein [Acinetobacter sp. CFCC 10889]
MLRWKKGIIKLEEKIELLASANWSKTNWDLSWQPVIDLNELLPKVGESYEITLLGSEADHTQNGIHYLLWLPPHSELNGFDERSTEIEKSYVIKAILDKGDCLVNEFSKQYEGKFIAKILAVNKLQDCLPSIQPSMNNSFVGYFNNLMDSSIQYFSWNDNLYLSLHDEYITYELFFKKRGSAFLLYFVNNWIWENYECYICRMILNEKQTKFISNFLISTNKLIPINQNQTEVNQVEGALYY